ncbi:hypothetical protein BH18ACI4_BH18ACI4_21180 [soil metagenome]
MVAAIFSHVDIARLLLAAGADARLQDNLGLTAREWANRRGSSEVAQLISNASLSDSEPSTHNSQGKQARSKAQAARRNSPAIVESTPQQDATGVTDEHQRTMADTLRREVEEAGHASLIETPIVQQVATGVEDERQITMAEPQLHEVDETPQATPIETSVALQQNAPTVADNGQEARADQGPSGAEEARPIATQSARIAATIEHLRILEESRQRVEAQVSAKSQRATVERGNLEVTSDTVRSPRPSMSAGVPYSVESPVDRDEYDTRQERAPSELSTRPGMLEPKRGESLNLPAVKRCPKCNATYENALLAYCAYDATKLISADDPSFNPPTSNDWSRPTLWALVAIIAVLGASLGYLINNYRSRQKASAPIAPKAEQPENVRKDLPKIDGELSGMEVNVPEPEYPAQAKADGVSGAVTVRVQVNKRGRVTLVRSSTGHWRLRAAAVEAAQKATFSEEMLAGRGASGTITYNFAAPTESSAGTESPTPTQTNSPPANVSSSPTGSSAANAGGDYPVVGGPLAGTERSLPQPDYPEKAKREAIYGTVSVMVRVNRAGQVVSWRTLSGDSQLRGAALKAARKATFSPEKLPGKGEVVGTITYNFKR